MGNEADETTEIRETDIVFDCPSCGKSLAIDYRGAGLNVRCPDCGENVQVPIPEGMDIADVDSTREEQVTRIRNLRKALTEAEARIQELEVELERLRTSADGSGSSPLVPTAARRTALRDGAQRIRRALQDIDDALEMMLTAVGVADEPPPPPDVQS